MRIQLPEIQCRELIGTVKASQCWTWSQFAEAFGVGVNTVKRNWYTGKTTLSDQNYQKLLSLYSGSTKFCPEYLEENWAQKMKRSFLASAEEQVLYSELYAEFYGAMLGDGCIYSNQSSLVLSGNKTLDSNYFLEYLQPLIKQLFGVSPCVNYQDNTIRLIVNSKKLCQWLHKQGFPLGEKKLSDPTIPEHFFDYPLLLKACLRGLLDTDGGVFHHPNTGVMLSINSDIPSLLESIQRAFTWINLRSGMSTADVQTYAQNTRKVMHEIGSSNVRNIIRYQHYLRFGVALTEHQTATNLNEAQSVLLPYHGPMI